MHSDVNPLPVCFPQYISQSYIIDIIILTGCQQSEAFLPALRNQSSQDDSSDPGLSCRIL